MLDTNKWSYWESKNYLENIDYLVIGSGIVGYSTALRLRELHENAKIVILERGVLPSGASSKNAGFACFGSPTEVFDDIQNFGEEKVWETVAKRWEGLNRLREVIGNEQLDLQINGSWDLFTENDQEMFEKTLPHLSHYNQKLKEITGEDDVYSVDKAVSDRFGFNGIVNSFHNRLEGQIDTGKMNMAFYRKAVERGIHVLFGIEVHKILEELNYVKISTNFGEFDAQQVAICTNGFAEQFLGAEDIQPARAQVLVTQPIQDLKIKGTFHYQQGYYYFRNIDGRILFGGGRNLDKQGETTTKMENTPLIMNRLKEILKDVILPDTEFTIDRQWAGIMGVGKTKQPIVKAISRHIYCGVRLGGMGVAIGSLVGSELAELIIQSSDHSS